MTAAFLTLLLLLMAPQILVYMAVSATHARKFALAESIYEFMIGLNRALLLVLPFKFIAQTLITCEINIVYVWSHTHQNAGRAVVLLKEADSICKRYGMGNASLRGMVLLNLSMALARTDRTEEAGECQVDAFKLFEAAGDITRQGLTFVSLAANSLQAGNIADGEKWANCALKVLPATLTAEERQLTDWRAKALNNIGIAKGYKCEWDKAKETFDLALSAKRAHLPATDPSVIVGLNNSAWAALKCNKLDEAEKYLSEARRSSRGNPHLGTNIPVTISINYAELLRKRKHLSEASDELNAALAISGAALEQTRASLYCEMANLYAAKQEFVEADRWYRDCISIWEKLEGSTHPKLAPVLISYAKCLRATDRIADAEKYIARAQEISSLHGIILEKVEESVA